MKRPPRTKSDYFKKKTSFNGPDNEIVERHSLELPK